MKDIKVFNLKKKFNNKGSVIKLIQSSKLNKFGEILNKYSDTSEWHNFFSTHPDTKKRIRNIQMQ